MADRRGPSRRKDSKQMWEESERTRPSRDTKDSRDARPSRDNRDERERDDRRRSYRSRSRERERERGGKGNRGDGRDRERDRPSRPSGNRGKLALALRFANTTSDSSDADRVSTLNSGATDRQRGEFSIPIHSRPFKHSADSNLCGDDRNARERRRSRSRGPRRSRSPRTNRDTDSHRRSRSPRSARDPGARGGKDRSMIDSGSAQQHNGILKSTEPHDPNKMEIDSKIVQQRSTNSSRHGSMLPHDGTPLPDTLKTTNTVENKYDDDIEVEVDPEMAAMQAMMGFGGFGSTQNKKVAGNDVSAVRKEKKTEYRQYMNRVGGFNRPLSPTRE